MVLFNYSTKELTAKIVYYGPGLCGKTTNLQFIYESLPDEKRGRMLSLSTQTDRTLYFDFLPMDLGEIRGMKTRIQLYTVPGQVFYNATRKMVLKGVDGVVFVADSQTQMADANLESFRNLLENLKNHGLDPTTIPLVLQFNKRDLPSILSVEEMNAALNRFNSPFYEAIATTGIGVHDTLKAASKLVLRSLSGRAQDDDLSDDARETAATAATSPAPADRLAPGAEPADAVPLQWNDDDLFENQLDQMDAAEIEGLLQEVEGFDLGEDTAAAPPPFAATVESPGVSDPIPDSSVEASRDDAADDDFSSGELELSALPDGQVDPSMETGPAMDDLRGSEISPGRPLSGAPDPDPALDGARVTATRIEEAPPSSELTLESFLATDEAADNDPPAPLPVEPAMELSDGGELHIPIRLDIAGRSIRYRLTLRLLPEDRSSHR